MSLVLDSSVTLAWLYSDEITEPIRRVFEAVAEHGAVVPALWRLEIANSLTVAARRGRIDREFRGAALGDLAPAQLSYASGQAHFAVNRREPSPEGIRIGVNPDGPVDPAVPVLRVRTSDGKLKAVLFGYACHNTTLTGEFYGISGDYAGFAQIELDAIEPKPMTLHRLFLHRT